MLGDSSCDDPQPYINSLSKRKNFKMPKSLGTKDISLILP